MHFEKVSRQQVVREFDIKSVSFLSTKKYKLQIDSLNKTVIMKKEGKEDKSKIFRLLHNVGEVTPIRSSNKVMIVKIKSNASGVQTKKEKMYIFNTVDERTEFCLMTALLAPQTISKIIAPNATFDDLKVFDVTMNHDTGNKRRQLVLNMSQKSIGRRLDPGKKEITKITPITTDVYCHCSVDDSKHLKLYFGEETTPSYDLTFDSTVSY
jgi:hypothetical protein